MRLFQRPASTAVAVVVICAIATSVALADTPAPPKRDRTVIFQMSESCRTFNAARRYGESLPRCLAAANIYRQMQIDRHPARFFLTYAQADMLAFAAADRAGLNQHADALQIALSAHRMLSDAARSYDLGATERERVVALANELVEFERVEAAVLRAGGARSPEVSRPARRSATPAGAARVARPIGSDVSPAIERKADAARVSISSQD